MEEDIYVMVGFLFLKDLAQMSLAQGELEDNVFHLSFNIATFL